MAQHSGRRAASPHDTEGIRAPLRAEPNGFRVHLLSRSDTVSCVCICAATAPEQKLTTTRREQLGHMLFLLRMSVVVPSVPGNQLSKDFRHRDSNTGRSGEGEYPNQLDYSGVC
jgi:hypothetical protein